jgi:hypothetical protein
MSTFENWINVMYAATANTGIGMQPVRDNQMYWVYFCILIELVCGLLGITLFVGVICNNYNRISKQRGTSALLTKEQADWVFNQRILLRLKPKLRVLEPKNLALNIFYRVKRNNYYPVVEFFVLLLGIIATMCTNFGQSDTTLHAIFVINIICSIYALVNILLAILSERVKFLYSVANIVDLVMGGVGDAVFLYDAFYGFKTILVPIGIVRLIRVIRLWNILNQADIECIQGPVNVIRSLVLTIPGVFNVGCLLFMLLFIYATMGVQFFAKIGYYNSYDDNANFRSFWTAVETMFQLGTINSW